MGIETADDAGVYLLNEDTALIQTVDFFTPIVDDPFIFGAIAATNALSDIYAMGGQPLTALNILAFPLNILGAVVLGEILQGGAQKIREAGALLLGGHSIQDNEPKYGLAVTGTARPDEIWTNAGVRAGDSLILTKPLGIGIITSALRKKKDSAGRLILQSPVDAETEAKAIAVMLELNGKSAAVARRVGINACTDITGFGLLGHAWEMARASRVQIEISLREVPVLEGARELGIQGYIAGGNWANLEYMKDKAVFAQAVEAIDKHILADPITSGGLIFAVKQERADRLLDGLHEAGITGAKLIGKATSGEPVVKVII